MRERRKKMNIILLTGRPHCGKTTTLTMVYDSLTNTMNPKPTKFPINNRNDFHSVFTYKKKRVAIYTAGDSFPLLLKAVFLYSDVDCLIMPFSVNGTLKTQVLTFFTTNCRQQTYINKTVSPNGANKTVKNNDNLTDCNRIIGYI